MQVSDQLIELFFSGGGSREERTQVMEYFKNNPDKLMQYLTEQSWEHFDEDAGQGVVPTRHLRQSVENRTGREPLAGRMVFRMAAASIIFLICVASFFRVHPLYKGKNKTMPAIEATAQATAKEEKKDGLRSITNKSAKAELYTLPDGSTVRLAGYATVSFNDPFINNRRDIFLKGEAVFTVIKDRLKPFAVHSGRIVTTALGTVFSVNSSSHQFTTVRLFSGRVVIRKENGAAGKSFKEVYLTPGQELVLNTEAFSAQIKMHKPEVREEKEKAGPPEPQVLEFTRQSLPEIFSTLQKDYNTRISYHRAAIKNMDFTGSFDRNKESLESFLNTLCVLNELKLKKMNGNSFSIQEK